MSLLDVFSAFRKPGDLLATLGFFRKLGVGWKDSLKNAVECMANHRFILF
jgi:hypothetical protein